ncbi:MAG: sensor histidine kinase [Luteolibacter sp.]
MLSDFHRFRTPLIRGIAGLGRGARLLAAAGLPIFAASPAAAGLLLSPKADAIRNRIAPIENELRDLPVIPINASPWTLGYSSNNHVEPQLPVEITIKFRHPAPLDLVALLPATYTDDENEVRAFAFPLRFSIERVLDDGAAEMLADHLDADFPAPGIEPQLFPCSSRELVTGLRITITKLAPNPTWWNTSHTTAISEVLAFSGDRNVALNADVQASASFEFSYVWSVTCITDGFTLFSPIDHSLSNPMENFSALRKEVVVSMDLGEERRIDEFHLWPVDHSIQHNFPASNGVGFPEAIRVELASSPDFSDSKTVFHEKRLTQRPGTGPFMHQIPPTAARYVRLTLGNGLSDFRRDERIEIALSEIEILESGKVVSSGLPFRSERTANPPRGLSKLTDGSSAQGRILPLRLWVTLFSKRVGLERTLDTLRLELRKAQREDEKRATAILFVAIILILGLVQLVWLVRAAARRRWAAMRERIACDLHDEIGANVSSIAHTAELLDESIEMPTEIQSRLLGNLVASARMTARETKHFIRFIEGENQDRDLTEQFGRVTEQILGTIPVSASFQNTRSFNRLDPSTKWNLLLFFKETLNNIIKHSRASAVEISTRRTGSVMELVVRDNGRGLPEGVATCRHLESRAKLLGGKIEIRSRAGSGTCVTLTFKRSPQS